MRPTLLNFRSPKERTPDFTEQQCTYNGVNLNFQAKTLNKKGKHFSQAERFLQYKLFKGGNKASGFLGPGTYNDHESYLKLHKIPCSSLMVSFSLSKTVIRKN
jgi:hypothetical protein